MARKLSHLFVFLAEKSGFETFFRESVCLQRVSKNHNSKNGVPGSNFGVQDSNFGVDRGRFG
jgi:hypothetical protein